MRASYSSVVGHASPAYHADEINERFDACLLSDESLPLRGVATEKEFARELELREGRVQRGERECIQACCIRASLHRGHGVQAVLRAGDERRTEAMQPQETARAQ